MCKDFPYIRQETRNLIDKPEDIEIEFKESCRGIDQDLLVSFANSRGGTIIAGVVDKQGNNGRQYGEIVGCSGSFDDIRLAIQNKSNDCNPPIEVKVYREYDGNNYIYRIDVEECSRKPCCTGSGKYIIRKDGQKQPILPDQISTIILQREASKFIKQLQDAGDKFVKDLKIGQENLSDQINRVDNIAKRAYYTSKKAKDIVINAESLADEAMIISDETHSRLDELYSLLKKMKEMFNKKA